MQPLVYFLVLIFILHQTTCHCPHMMGLLPKDENTPKAPGILPEGDKGWDFDEPSGAPGSLPVEYFIQTSFIHRSNTARVTIDNENVACADDAKHYRCDDFPEHGSYHFLVIEDSSRGAAIYSLDHQLNKRSEGTTEMAILDALSRHSPHSLTIYASTEAEKEVGFVRALSTKEIESLNSRKVESDMIKFSPLELNLLEPSLLELRYINTVAVYAISLHAFNLWARVSLLNDESVILAHVECHKHADFCEGLHGRDFHTIAAYRNGENIRSVYHISDEQFYLDWIRLMTHGPLIELKTEEEYKNAKKGNAPTTLSTYRLWEKKKRLDYEGRFDPSSVMTFITQSTIPSVIDISMGFTTDILFHQQRSILILVAEKPNDVQAYRYISEKTSVKKTVVLTSMIRSPIVDEVLSKLDLPIINEPQLILLNKEKVHHTLLGVKSAEELLNWIHSTKETAPHKILSVKEGHPLRLLQIRKVDIVFGIQNIVLLPDETIFNDKTHSLPSIHTPINSGGCPFMAAGGTIHEEL
uniref:ER membrane protein complex subunit 1 n=1 Tax=Heterorhabditis bacteriophora TaxID=37862 RepID=A0A1I7X2G0_HETBA